MKVTQVEYKKLVNLGNFEHHSLGVSVVLEDGETAHEAVARARKYVEAELTPRPNAGQWASAKQVLENPDNYTGHEVKQAKAIAALCEQPEEIPF